MLPEYGYKYELHGDEWYFHENCLAGINKDNQLDTMIGDRNSLWLVDSNKYFDGVCSTVMSSYHKHYGGIKFLVVVTTPTLLKAIMDTSKESYNAYSLKRECVKYADDYITHYRYAGIPGRILTLGFSTGWDTVESTLIEWAEEPAGSWYLHD
jgi:hypothetical protein